MATYTLQDVVNLFRSLTAPQSDELEIFRKHVGLYNAAQLAVWKILTSRKPMNNWFVVESQGTSALAVDYFAPLAVGTRDYALPPNFHHIRLIECATTDYVGTKFRKDNMDSPQFKEAREATSATPFGSEVLYDIIGTNPGRIMFSGYPPAALDVRLWYCKSPAKLTLLADSLDEFPPESIALMARWAVTQFLLGADQGKWADFERQWSTEIERAVFGDMRDDTGPTVVQGFLE